MTQQFGAGVQPHPSFLNPDSNTPYYTKGSSRQPWQLIDQPIAKPRVIGGSIWDSFLEQIGLKDPPRKWGNSFTPVEHL